ncbi:MAG: hypothetical protein PHD88_05060 [Firmicutes bacterium]|nr:hypothetical protein [Bacillota bacterium]MDD4693756.1 hypothetical protein [Bacillota bacterium]
MSRNRKLLLMLVLALAVGSQVFASVWIDEISAVKTEDLKSYLSLTQEYQDDNWYKVNSKVSRLLEAEDATLGGGAVVSNKANASGGKVVTGFDQAGAYMEWEFDAPSRGQYEIWLKYSIPCNDADPVVMDITIDGKHLFSETTDLHFNSVKYETAVETLECVEPASDKGNGVPFGFIMEKGKHRIRITNISGEFDLDYIRFSGPVKHFVFTQGETCSDSNGEFEVVKGNAASRGKAVQTTDAPGEWIEWTIDVPEDGLYSLIVRYTQGTRGVESVRSFKVNGKTLFPSWDEVVFYPTDGWSEKRNDWRERRIEDPETRQPYYLYMPKGEITIRMETVSGPLNIDYIGIITRDGEIKGELNFWDYLRMLWQQIIGFFVSFN